nr:NUDIX hydrolase [Micromonospora sp. DSM 115978]
MSQPVRAAGGVVWRPAEAGDSVQVCLVHRPRYDDWSLPKGKLEPGEHPLLAAVREVAEEAGVRGVPQVRLPGTSYLTRDGLPKVVDFWSMLAAGNGGFQADTEVDGMRWLTVDEAVDLVSYPHDATVLRDFAALPPVTAVFGLVRHAPAGKRATWSGPDTARPLDDTGWALARELAPILAVLRPRRLLSASPRRCVQTLDPLAELLDLPIEVDSRLDEPEPGQDADENALLAAARIAELAAGGISAALCSQGKVIPEALARLAGADAGPGPDYRTPKGTGWLLAFAGDKLVGADRLAGTDES